MSDICSRCKCDINTEIESLNVIEKECLAKIEKAEKSILHEKSVLDEVRRNKAELI